MRRLLWIIPAAVAAVAIPIAALALGVKGPADPGVEKRPVVATALFAGGDFRALQLAFQRVYGVTSADAGQADRAPGESVQAVMVGYAPDRVDYAALLDVYLRSIDPTDQGGQFGERGGQFSPGIFWADEGQKQAALEAVSSLSKSGRFSKPVSLWITKATQFRRSAEADQDWAWKHRSDYSAWVTGSGRKELFERAWRQDWLLDPVAPPALDDPLSPYPAEQAFVDQKPGRMTAMAPASYMKPSREELQKRLTPIQFQVTQQDGTEPPYDNPFWDNHKEGIYVDVVSGEPLFSSKDKYDSGTGWPSFTMPLALENVVTKADSGFGMIRTEVRSRWADSHLGHVFNDGPAPTGLRYCMDSASLRFIPVADMARDGYGKYLPLFGDGK